MRKVEMLLERDEFLVTYDPSKANDELLIETVKNSGYTAQVVTKRIVESEEKEITVLPTGFPILDKALARAKAENKPLVVDFNAEWCVPCRRLEKEVFANPKLEAQLRKVVLVRIDTDIEHELSKKLGVVGLPDIRFATSDGRIVHKSVGFQDAESFKQQLDDLLNKMKN